MTLEVEQLSDLSQVLEDYVREKGADAGGKNKLNLDEELDLEALSLETVKSFERLAPLEWIIRNLFLYQEFSGRKCSYYGGR